MGGRDRTLFATAWAPRDPRGAEVAGALTDVQVPQKRVDWCSPCAFCTKLHHERATMTHPHAMARMKALKQKVGDGRAQ